MMDERNGIVLELKVDEGRYENSLMLLVSCIRIDGKMTREKMTETLISDLLKSLQRSPQKDHHESA